MSETKQTVIRKLSLDEAHRAAGATMTSWGGWSVPADYGDEREEYLAVRKGGCGLLDLSTRGRLLVTGSEAIQFLNGLITNDMKTLDANRWMPAIFPNVQGRILASVRVIKLESAAPNVTFLIDTESETFQTVATILNRFTMAGDFKVSDWTAEWALISVQGKSAAQQIRTSFGIDSGKEKQSVFEIEWSGEKLIVIRATHTSEDGFDLFVPAENAAKLWQSLRQSGAQPVGLTAAEVLRIEAGHPRYGIDMDETNVVSETNLDEAVSFTKGCYIGQEIIARIKYRGHVAKKITGILFDKGSWVEKGTRLFSQDEKEVGRLTSVTFSPHLDRPVALGYVKYGFLAPGTSVTAESGDKKLSGIVTEVPFVRGSWYE